MCALCCTEVLKLALGTTTLSETADSAHGLLKTWGGGGGVLPHPPVEMEVIICLWTKDTSLLIGPDFEQSIKLKANVKVRVAEMAVIKISFHHAL